MNKHRIDQDVNFISRSSLSEVRICMKARRASAVFVWRWHT